MTTQLAGPLLRAGVQTSTARLLPPDTIKPTWHILGDPVEAALIVVAAKAGTKPASSHDQEPQLAALNSDREIALDGVIVREAGSTVVYVKGAPADLLARCTAIASEQGERPLAERDRQNVKRTLQRYQRDAMRTIAFARRTLGPAELRASSIGEVASELTLLGMIAVVDPPREEVAEAIEAVHTASIRTIMLTGDDTIGATSVARRCTMVQSSKPLVVSGPELEAMDQTVLKAHLRAGDMVLARLTPEHKVRVVEALESMGEVVCVTGSAASDVPALKAAYTGIAMGATGSQAAMAAADLVLTDDNFATIAEAIAEGRAVEQRVRRLVMLNLADDGGQAGSADRGAGSRLAAAADGWTAAVDRFPGRTAAGSGGRRRTAGPAADAATAAPDRPPIVVAQSVPARLRLVRRPCRAARPGGGQYISDAAAGADRGPDAVELFGSNLLPSAVREAMPAGQSGLVATSL